MKRLDLGFEPYARIVARTLDICSPRASRLRLPFPSPGGYVKLNEPDEPPTPLQPLEWKVPDNQTSRSRPWWKIPVCVFLCTSLWWCAAILVILEIKHVVGALFPYPFALTALVQPSTAVFAWLLSLVVYRKRPKPPQLEMQEVAYLALLGLIQGLEIGLTNKALEFLTVAARTMISSTGVLFMMATAWFWGLEDLGALRLISGLTMIIGGIFQGEDHRRGAGAMHWLGIGMQLLSMILSAQRWALVQFVMQRSPQGSGLAGTAKLQLLARTLPVTGAVSLVLSGVFEQDAFTSGKLVQAELFVRVVIIAASLTGMLYAELKLVSLLSAVAFNVLSTVHQIPIVLAGVMFQHNHVSLRSASGFACCIVGALIYAAARHLERSGGEA